MKNIRTIIFPILITLFFIIPSISNAQTSCDGAIINGVCNAQVTPGACANSLFAQTNGTETCQVIVNGQYITATFSGVDHSAPVVTHSASCSGPVVNGLCRSEITSAQSSCIAGTL